MPVAFSKSTLCFKPAAVGAAAPQVTTEKYFDAAQVVRLEYIERELAMMIAQDNVDVGAYETGPEHSREFMVQCWARLVIRLPREQELVAELIKIVGEDVYGERYALLEHCDVVASVIMELESRTA